MVSAGRDPAKRDQSFYTKGKIGEDPASPPREYAAQAVVILLPSSPSTPLMNCPLFRRPLGFRRYYYDSPDVRGHGLDAADRAAVCV